MDRAVPGQSQQKARPCAGAEGNVPSGLSGSASEQEALANEEPAGVWT